MERFVTTPAREADADAAREAEAPLRVIIADDDPLARRIVRDALHELPNSRAADPPER